jgi:LacI family transcriptional regulator
MTVRLKDIAKDLNVSVVTVSKVLRNRSDIGAETRERILRRMRELDYRPNLAARSLATGRTSTVGLIVPSLLHPFFAEAAKGIVEVIRPKGYGLLISSSDEDEELERQEIEQLLARRVDALIVASVQRSPAYFRKMDQRRVPWILMDRRLPGLASATFIGVDDEAVGFMAAEHLIERGCTRIAHIRGPEISPGLQRLAGYRKALASRLESAQERVAESKIADNCAEDAGYEAMRQLLKPEPIPDGVFCYNDPVAVGAIRAILEAGLKIPDDVAVVGCGNARWSGMLRVPLSSVDQGAVRMGERAAKLALRLIGSTAATKGRTILLPATVVVRESSAFKPAKGRPGPRCT